MRSLCACNLRSAEIRGECRCRWISAADDCGPMRNAFVARNSHFRVDSRSSFYPQFHTIRAKWVAPGGHGGDSPHARSASNIACGCPAFVKQMRRNPIAQLNGGFCSGSRVGCGMGMQPTRLPLQKNKEESAAIGGWDMAPSVFTSHSCHRACSAVAGASEGSHIDRKVIRAGFE